MECDNVDSARAGMFIDHARIAEVLAKNRMRLEELFMQLWEGARMVSPGPLGHRQRSTCIGKARRPM